MRLPTAILVTLVALVLPAHADPIGIVAAENFYGDLATQIGGSHVAVTSILSNPDADPHLFESSASTARSVADAQIVIANGVGYDPWIDRLLSSSAAPDRTVIVAADLLHAGAADNPHLWYNPQTFPAVAKALADDLAHRDPAHAAEYAANAERFDASFATAISAIAAIKAAHPAIAVTATEPVFGYMAEALGFSMLNLPFQAAMMNDTEPSPRDVAAFEDSLKSGTAKILFYNSQVTDDTTSRFLELAKSSHVPVVGVTETEPAGATIQSWFAAELASVAGALGP